VGINAQDGMQAAISVTLLGTHPGPVALLHYQEPFYLRFQVDSHTPVRVLAEAYYRGEEVPVATLGERKLTSGGTDATLIFHWPEQPTPVDEVRLVVRRMGQQEPVKTLSLPVNLTWGTEPAASPRPAPLWVREFEAQRDRERALDPDYQAYRERTAARSRGWTVWAWVVGLTALLAGAGGFYWARRHRPNAK